MNASKNHRIAKAKQKMAAGILIQARRDLRRFHDQRTALERELYLDAYTWVNSDSQRWPFSFLNVCKLVNLPPEQLRVDLLDEVSLGALDYWSRCGMRLLRQFQTSLRQMFISERNHSTPQWGTLTHSLS